MTDRAPAGGWRQATVRQVNHPTRRGVQLRLEVPDRVAHWPGQHYVLRLTAPDGYTAQRSYSIASAPDDELVEFYVERLDNGEVSTFLSDVVQPGDVLDVRGPIGGWFVWRADSPAVGLAGGSGVVPFISMLRHADRARAGASLRLGVSAASLLDLPYAAELREHGVLIALTRDASGTDRPTARLSRADVASLLPSATGTDQVGGFVCGSARFAEAASQLLMAAGLAAERIRVERFGPTS